MWYILLRKFRYGNPLVIQHDGIESDATLPYKILFLCLVNFDSAA